MHLYELLARNARKYPDQVAFIEGLEQVTYGEADRKVKERAAYLQKLGFEKGDRGVIMIPNSLEFIYTYFSILSLGGIVVPINIKLIAEEVAFILNHSEAKAIFVHESLLPNIQMVQVMGTSTQLFFKTGEGNEKWFGTVAEQVSTSLDLPTIDEWEDAAILYTSGTTGRPKGAVFTHHHIFAIATMMGIEMKIDHCSRLLHMMPLSHSAPLHLQLVPGVYVGATHILSPQFHPQTFLQLIDRHRVTHFFGAPVAYLLSMQQTDFHEHNLSSVTHFFYGGAPLSREMVHKIANAFGNEKMVCVYGLTEAGPNGTALFADEHDNKAGSIGKRAVLNAEIKVVDEDGNAVGANQHGEILLYSEGRMREYLKNPEATEATIRDGWICTGDIARIDEDGYIWIIDRKKDVIISGGVNIYPSEIEQLLSTHPSVAEAVCVGKPHPEWGESIVAFLVLRDEIVNLKDTINQFLKGKIADYKFPREYRVMKELPRNASGKILKNSLREQLKGD